MVLKGYVLKDDAGVLGIVPAAHADSGGEPQAWDYIRKNRILQTVYAEPDEDLVDFIIRINRLADRWRMRFEHQNTN
ncbi:hypothetical protein HYT45_01425 [Candidatus Uhrbacteria bacterium]|nr:hypothetical protein [Candidatus Uhrbacteria bacterium]